MGNKRYTTNKRKKASISTNLKGYTIEKLKVGKTWSDSETQTFEPIIIVHDEICSYFGCGIKLSMREKLFGTRCINHTDKTKWK
jgi:hypothetical protein